ncbi:calsenilin-like isoform X4 [Portunus trituberculatus]|uniref:calsenilin-like isoform X4 n=1 Tax=Portunus trituberculatus TaxID=210409 RepID=UPI001E1CD750|nr:calsenilin-like isoform X4 [Portunus trituberculatus]
MATPPDSPYGDFMLTFETVRPVKHKPVKLEELCKQTKFTRQEIRLMYRGFKQECPEGVVQEDAFKEIYAKFFPHGNSSLYAHHVFKAFDLNSNGQISFRDLLVSLSQLLRGTAYDKLKFAFKLYDVNGDGCITKAELTDIVSSVHELMGRNSHNRHEADDGLEEVTRAGVEDKQTREHVERLFKKLDLNGDGVVTIDEFIQSCMQDEVITESLKVFEGL